MKLRLLFLALALTLSACATTTPGFKIDDPQVRSAWKHHQKVLKTVNHWQLSGRFGASTETDAWSGSLSWQQQDDEYAITLSGPLNQGTVQLSGDKRYARLRLDEDQIFVDSDADALLQLHTGMQLPVSGLRYWILGLPSPSKEAKTVELNANGQIQLLKEGHWQVDFKRYKTFGDVTLPTKIFLQHDHVSVRLVLDKWNING